MQKILLLLLIPIFGMAQTADYELQFNSPSLSYVDIPNTSAVIANKTAFSISGWVNPQTDNSHSGLFGFRNNIDADFYLLQLQNTNNIEARFRNSSGANYDIVAMNLLDFGQWQHLAFTYDGSYIRLYKDGTLVDSTAANGTTTQLNQSFKLGALDWQGTLFHMMGNLDEIRLWDVALSANEINNWMCVGVDSTHPNYTNLMGYWNLNEGIGSYTDDQTANGNNGTLFGGTTWQVSSSCLGGAVLCGDVNEDGMVDQTDVIDINSYIMGGFVPVFNLWAADVNCDGTINILDITMLNSFISGTGSLNCCSSTTPPQTYVPDDNFENYLEANGMGDGIALNDSVLTLSIEMVMFLDVSYQNISDMTGIEGFTVLQDLICKNNLLSSLDISQNVFLIYLDTEFNAITSLDLSSNISIETLKCRNNNITTIDISNNSLLVYLDCDNNQITNLSTINNLSLEELYCSNNQIIYLDLSSNITLYELNAASNQLISLDVRNGNNQNMSDFYSTWNSSLNCIDVDDIAWSTVNWTLANANIDAQHYFSTDCSVTAIEETVNSEKELIKITDVLGREVIEKTNQSLFYIYDDGTVEKKIIIE